jgi:nitrile hydratase beta subunit
MNSIHDMGGMQGFGPLVIEVDEPLFHESWEARAVGLNAALGAWGRWNVDAFRLHMECIPAVDYLHMPYYLKWLTALTALAIERGLVTRDEVACGRPAAGAPKLVPALAIADVVPAMERGTSKSRTIAAPPRFALGDGVRAININPITHTRLPRYVRGRVGKVIASHGGYIFPDTNSLFQGESPQHVYTVRFSSREVWGEAANPFDSVCVDLWESYLDHA